MSQTLTEHDPQIEREFERLTRLEHEVHDDHTRREGWLVLAAGVSLIALVVAMVAVGFGARAAHDSKGGTAAAASTGASTVSVHLSEFAIQPKAVSIATGGTLEVMNMGTVPHNVAVKGTSFASKMLAPGGTEKLALTGLAPGNYTLICQVPGHEAAGMVASLTVGGAAAPAAAAPASSAASSTSADAAVDFNATPEPTWHAFDPTLQPASGATVHNVTFHAGETQLEVAPGVKQEMWTFNGQVPGPVLRGHVGDVFNVTLVNDGKMGHSIDFHASKVSPTVAMKTLQPGESLVYQFKADYAGIWMYHCGTAPALHHIGNGMYGAVVIDPPDLPAVAHEYVMVQSELYTGPQGQAGDLTKMQQGNADAVMFNGYVNQYKFAPIKVGAGERVRVWVLDAGPNDSSSFHIVGTIFDTVFKEGKYQLRPDATHGGSQTLDLAPAQGGFVEFTLNDVGQYPMVTHRFADVGKGALGLFQVGDVPGTMSH